MKSQKDAADDARGLTIGQLARRAGVGVETIRFYQREGLIEEPPRHGSSFRRYTLDAVRRIRFIRRAKELGFSLTEIAELLTLRLDEQATCSAVRRRAVAKLEELEGRMRSLERMVSALRSLVSACAGQDPIATCPIFEALDGT